MSCKFTPNDKPVLTMMVHAETLDRVFELIKAGHEKGTDAFGFQIECLEHKYRTEEIFKEIFDKMRGKPAYVTNYRGSLNENMTDDERVEQLLLAVKCGANLIDVIGDLYDPTEGELTENPSAIEKQKELIKKIHSMGAEVLMSSHTFRFMSTDEVVRYVNAQHDRGADIAKIVGTANTRCELMQNINTTMELTKPEYGSTLFLCTGDYCKVHRVAGPLIGGGMFLCVAEYDELATVSQPLIDNAKNVIRMADL